MKSLVQDFLRKTRENRTALESAKADEKAALNEYETAEARRICARERRVEIERDIEKARGEALVAVLSTDLVDVLAPDHSGKCSDNETHNDNGSCARCTMLRATETKFLEGKWAFTMEPLT